MATILDPSEVRCECFDCLRDAPFHPHYCRVLQNILPADPVERCRFMQKIYYLKPLRVDSWTKDWKSVTHRDFVFKDDIWTTKFPEKDLDLRPEFIEYTCQKWCKERHNDPLPAGAYSAQIMPNLFEEPRRPIYSNPRKCSSIAHMHTITRGKMITGYKDHFLAGVSEEIHRSTYTKTELELSN